MKVSGFGRVRRPAMGGVLVGALGFAVGTEGGPRVEDTSARNLTKSPTARQVIGPETHLQSLVAGAGATMTISLTPAFSYPGGTYNTEGLYTDANINGQTLTIVAGGGTSYWEVKLANWDPAADCPDPGNGCGSPTLRNWQARPDPMGWYSGTGDPLDNKAFACTASAQCADAAHLGSAGSGCSAGSCRYAFLNKSAARTDQFRQEDEFSCADPTWDLGPGTPNDPPGTEVGPLFFGSNDPDDTPNGIFCGMVDRHTAVYGGTMALAVPAGASGTYTLGFIDGDTFATDPDAQVLPLAAEIPGVLAIPTAPCCFCNGRCEELVLERCAVLGGEAGAVGQTCANVQCPLPGDLVDDGRVDLDDWAAFEPCVLGPLELAVDHCLCADLSHDGYVDLEDVAMFWAAFGTVAP